MIIAGFILSLLATLGALYTYISHDRRIKKQENLINEYQLKRFQSEEIDIQKALIKGNIVKGDKGRRKLIIFNAGKAIANNIRLEVLSELVGIINFEFEPYEMLNPQDKTEINFYLLMGHSPTLKVKYFWNDQFKEDNEFVQVLSL